MKIKFDFEERNVKLGLENQFTIQEFLEVTPVKILMLKGEKGDTVSAEWGTITGDIEDQTDLKNALDSKANTTDIPDVSDFITKDVDNLTNYTKTSDLSEVATSGDYDDLDNKPTIPSKTSDLTNDSGYIDNTVDNLTNYTKTSNLSTVATSGSYNDLSNKPTIPSKTSDLTNDSNFAVTNADNKFTTGQTIAGETVVDSIRTKNIFGNYTIINGYIYETLMRTRSDHADRLAFIECKPNTTYTISRSVITSSFRVSDSVSIPPVLSTNTDTTIPLTTENNTGTTITYTTSSNAKYLIVMYGNMNNDANINESLATIQVEEGDTATSYSSYQELNIDNLKNQELVVGSARSKNMLNKNIYDLGYYDNSGTFTNSSTNVVFSYIPVESNKNYVFSAVSNCQNIAIVEFDSSKTFIKRNILYSNKAISITTTSTTKYIRCQLNYNNSTITKDIIDTLKPQLETGNTATAYSPYQQLGYSDAYKGIPSYNNTYISQIGYCNYIRYGRLVIVNMNAQVSQNLPTNTVLFSNLPPLRAVDRALGSITFANNNSARVYLEGTEIKVDGATNITGWFQGQIVYITD